MKSFSVCLMLLFFLQTSRAQNNSSYVNFIRSVVHKRGVIYTDSLGYYDAIQMKKAFNEQLARHYTIMGNNLSINSFHLTHTECAFINEQLDSLGTVVWKPGLVQGSRLLRQDTVAKIFHKSDILGWAYFYKHYGTYLYSFGKPIFLRSHTICLFYFGYGCGDLCGFGSLCIYVKEKGIWKNQYTIYSWIS